MWYMSKNMHSRNAFICGLHGTETIGNIGVYFILLLSITFLYCNEILFYYEVM